MTNKFHFDESNIKKMIETSDRFRKFKSYKEYKSFVETLGLIYRHQAKMFFASEAAIKRWKRAEKIPSKVSGLLKQYLFVFENGDFNAFADYVEHVCGLKLNSNQKCKKGFKSRLA